MRLKLLECLKSICVIVLLVAVFVGGAATMHFFPGVFGVREETQEISDKSKEKLDLKLPGEKEKREITVEEIKVKLNELSEFSTYSGNYKVKLGKKETRYWLEKMKIPGTTNKITISCEGTVKIGYDFSEIHVQIDDDKIYIAIPKAKVNDNYVIWDTVKCKEKNNILNPIGFSQYQEMIDEIEEKGLAEAEKAGIYDAAEENLKKLIEGFFAEFEGYEIVFM